jgi:two-component system, OmpR family, sensor histidine kinase KdpD
MKRRFPGVRAFGAERPPLWLGIGLSVVTVAAATGIVYPLRSTAPVASLSVVYLPAVAIVAVFWGWWLGLITALLSAAAFNFFHLPPVGRFTIADSRNWVALAAFTIIAAIVSAIAGVARLRTEEAELRRREADLAADLARELLAGTRTDVALRGTAHLIAEALQISSAAIELGDAKGDERREAVPLYDTRGHRLATLLAPRPLRADTADRIRHQVAPALGALIAVALDREAAQREAVETAALRRSDELKTALLRATSHDLRTPVTAILAAGHALRTRSITDEERRELSEAVVEQSERLSSLIDKLLDLSRLQSGRAEPRLESVSLEEVVLAARDALPEPIDARITADPDVPPIRADAAQLERVVANLLENAWHYSGRRPVSVHIRRDRDRVVLRVVDQGPGIPAAEQERIFEPFYRSRTSRNGRWSGSGLGLAIVKGFVEANDGTITVDSLPGQGTSFVVSFSADQLAPAPT